ncbi:MAG: hypothetical protein K2R98_27615 [Gemmataceae bacterium]|nr:hypothetical protein [Gemmataceae bacterium]
MLRAMVAAVAVLVIGVNAGFAAEIKGKVTKFDKDKNTISVEVDGKTTEYKIDKDTKFTFGKKDVDNGAEFLSKMMERVKDKGLPVVIEVEKDVVKKFTLGLNSATPQPNPKAPGLQPAPGGPVKPIQIQPLPGQIKPIQIQPAQPAQ